MVRLSLDPALLRAVTVGVCGTDNCVYINTFLSGGILGRMDEYPGNHDQYDAMPR